PDCWLAGIVFRDFTWFMFMLTLLLMRELMNAPPVRVVDASGGGMISILLPCLWIQSKRLNGFVLPLSP
ncbi:hypothetical protein, partial [Pseudomonas syringae group genomosp. 7]|uniref:hypothetical protein n=1 Tax=Pseudomonas syringae group genomosp. 7 TaxID=251699 RepID=UPI00376F6E21